LDKEFPLKKYDCAKSFDKFATDMQDTQYWTGQIYSFNNDMINDINIYDFLDNRCYTTYKTWKSDSDYDHFITKASPYFEIYSWQEQMFNNEIACEKDYESLCNAKEKSKIYVHAVDKYCKGINETSPQSDKDKCWKNVMNELEKYKDNS